MATSIIDYNVMEFASLLRRIRHLKPFLNAKLPEELVEIHTRLEQTHPGGKAGSAADMELLQTVAVALTRQPEPLSMGELSRLLDVPLSSATRIIDWLVESGYLERLPDPQDRRVVRVGLTQIGWQIYQRGNAMMHEKFEKWLASFTAEECQTLIDLLAKLVDAMEKDQKEKSDETF
jgi:DNA-binding MarR family transcriptional regulator